MNGSLNSDWKSFLKRRPIGHRPFIKFTRIFVKMLAQSEISDFSPQFYVIPLIFIRSINIHFKNIMSMGSISYYLKKYVTFLVLFEKSMHNFVLVRDA